MAKHIEVSIKSIQGRLKELGFDPGPIDGMRGSKTIRAIKQFQIANHLFADGIAGKQTIAMLFKENDPQVETIIKIPSEVALPWYGEARRLLKEFKGEIPGPESNEEILSWADELDLEKEYNNDDIPWCGLMQGHIIKSTLPDEPIPAELLWARSWGKFGKHCEPVVGACLVFWRGKKDGPSGHVGSYAGEDDECYHVLGGNQSDRVTIARIAKNRLLDCRWPVTFPYQGKRVYLARNGTVSVNEA